MNSFEYTALTRAIRAMNSDMILQLLYVSKVDPNEVNMDKTTAAYWAIERYANSLSSGVYWFKSEREVGDRISRSESILRLLVLTFHTFHGQFLQNYARERGVYTFLQKILLESSIEEEEEEKNEEVVVNPPPLIELPSVPSFVHLEEEDEAVMMEIPLDDDK